MEKSQSPEKMASKGSSAAHSRLVADVLIAIGTRPDCRVWKNATGVARALTDDSIIRYGLVGSADIFGITADGKFLAIECKTGASKQRKKQRNFMNMIRKMGGRYIICRDVSDVVEELDSLNFVFMALGTS